MAGQALMLSDGANDCPYAPSRTPPEQTSLTPGATECSLSDDRGPTRALFVASGAVDATFSYDAYGNLTSSTGSASTPIAL